PDARTPCVAASTFSPSTNEALALRKRRERCACMPASRPMSRTEKKRRYDREWKRKRYAEDPDYRAKIISATNAYAKTHRPQINARLRKRYASDPAFRAACSATRRGVELKKYGLTQATYDKLLAWQGGACLICGRPVAKRRLCVDHCHASDLIRALLCHGCNTAAGSVGGEPLVAPRAAACLQL